MAAHVPSVDSGDRLLDVVAEMLEQDGYDAVQLRAVARRAQVSLATIYKRFGTRDEMIFAALQHWMQHNRYADLGGDSPKSDASLHESLMQLLRPIFEPWERHPRMLTAYFRARSSAQGQQLFRFGLELVAPAGLELLADVDDEFVASLDAIITTVIYGLLSRHSAGEIDVTDIIPILDQTVFWVVRGYESGTAEPKPVARVTSRGRAPRPSRATTR
ncbi:TetR family transcriptional regulator [Mycolicibacterium bacteremicum]|nr:TetR family transcriptional regulator [Mycolicibacterium bacteremicum]MCV7432433.1 TetR/AcrR family transcriptional regulator [Mycolicibacterium bacteremicum]